MPERRRQKTIHAAIAVIERRGRYLICQRRHGDTLGGYWEFPGGKREIGESWTACLRRELLEELGVEGGSFRYAGRLRYRYPTASVVFQVYRCAISGRPRPLASEMLRWVRADRLTRYRFPPANRRLIVRLSITFASRKLSLNV